MKLAMHANGLQVLWAILFDELVIKPTALLPYHRTLFPNQKYVRLLSEMCVVEL